jgi:hypothetical protein
MGYPYKDSTDRLVWDLAEFETDYRYWRFEKNEQEEDRLEPADEQTSVLLRTMMGIAEGLRLTMIEQTDRIVEAIEEGFKRRK